MPRGDGRMDRTAGWGGVGCLGFRREAAHLRNQTKKRRESVRIKRQGKIKTYVSHHQAVRINPHAQNPLRVIPWPADVSQCEI